jgi:glycine cleavage system H protein
MVLKGGSEMVAIFVVLTIVAFVLVDAIVQRSEARQKLSKPKPIVFKTPVAALVSKNLSVPGTIFLGSGHTCVGLEASGQARVGLDDFVHQAVGRIDRIELPTIGQKVRQGDELFAIRQDGRKAAFKAPIDGIVNSVNESLTQNPGLIKEGLFQQGWVCALAPKNLARNLKQLLIAEDAMAWLEVEVQRFQEFIVARPIEHMALGHVLQDGGKPMGGVLELMDDETWRLFSKEFLLADPRVE